jgi:GrpB-like predicted nucleotidyltransferase (UPF0157 family)/chloramphenicol 3-O-phosphotransferase
MIVIINGPVGVGKTEVAWKLIGKFDRAVMLDGDYLGAIHPFEIYDEQCAAYLYDTICHVARFHVDHGWNNLVVDYVFETPESLAQLRRALNEIDDVTYAYRLTCNAEEIDRRIRLRGNSDPAFLAWELKRFRELQAIQTANAKRGDLGYVIDTTNLSIDEVADAIWRDITSEVTIVPYNPAWPQMYEEEREKTVGVSGDHIAEIHHVGSTAVPGLPAKPIVDIMITVPRLADAIECIGLLSDLGYTFIDYPQNTDRRFFRKGQPRTHHVHIVETGSAELRDHLAFRDALRTNAEWRDQYAALKIALADRHRNDRAQYSDSKTGFVQRVLSSTK